MLRIVPIVAIGLAAACAIPLQAQTAIVVNFNEMFGDCCFGPSGYAFRKDGIGLLITKGYVVGWEHISIGSPYYSIDPGNCFGCGSQASISFSSAVAKVQLSLRGFRSGDAPVTFMIGGQVSPFEITVPSGVWQKISLPIDGVRQFTIQRKDLSAFGIDDLSFEPFAPPLFTFDLGPQSPETQRRVLIHKYRNDDFYPSTEQILDGSIQIRGRVTSAGVPVAGKTVHFRVIDPPDAALYSVVNQQSHANDNEDKAGGKMSAASAASDANGVVRTALLITGFASGDNYVVEASFDPKIVTDPSFFCGLNTNDCWKSGTFTAWKRVYVEVNKMFRQGKYLIDDVKAGEMEIPVTDLDGLTAPLTVKLIHAPKPNAIGAFYEENVRIVKLLEPSAQNARYRIRLDPAQHPNGLNHSYDGPLSVGAAGAPPTSRAYLADAIGVITGTPAVDYYLPSMRLVAPLFEQSYVEHVWLTDTVPPGSSVSTLPHAGFLPFHPNLRGGAEPLKVNELAWLAKKWTHHAQRLGTRLVTDPNHQILFLTSTHITPEQSGLALVMGGSNDTWVHVPRFGSDTELAEGVAHELAHGWRVNHPTALGQQNSGHCDDAPQVPFYKMFGTDDKMCLMTSYVFGGNQGSDGVVGFHYTKGMDGKPHSEYLQIRRRPEPIPQNELPRQEPQ